MWMMGCSDGSGLNTSESFTGRKLRLLIPRPTATSSSATTTSSSCFSSLHGNDLFMLHNHVGIEPGKRDLPVSSRWNPTPEQLRTLENLYRRGTRTPTAEQIQHITAQLRRFGKIEGKNVFYWFQNHKARERQKRRRQTEAAERESKSLERKDYSVGSRTGFQVEGSKNWSPPANCNILTEESASMSRTAAESRRNGLLQCDREPQQLSSPELQATWQMMHLSCPSHTTTISTTRKTNTEHMLLGVDESFEIDNEYGDSQTLQLFPLRSDDVAAEKNPMTTETIPVTANFTPYQFFQFL